VLSSGELAKRLGEDFLSDAQVRAALGHVDSSSRYPERDRVMILLSVKAGLRDIQELAGHSSLATTQRYIQGDSRAKQNVVRMI
jgi:site-specific recombinase XerD